MKKKINIPHIISFVLFFGMLISLIIATILSPKEDFSETENRYLSAFPKLTVKKITDRSFMNGVETYLADHFVGRPNWIELKTNFELLCGERDINGVYILKDRLVEKLNPPDYAELDKTINAINKFSVDNRQLSTYIMLVPTATEVYKEDLPRFASTYSQKELTEYVSNRLNDKIINLPVYEAMTLNKDEYIYYRNDHHWTTMGAFYAYQSVGKKLGFAPISYNKFNVEHAANDFKGTLYSKVLYDEIEADTVDIFTNSVKENNLRKMVVNTGSEKLTYDDMYFREYLSKKDKYSTFLGSNQPIIDIYTKAETTESIVIFKDSYAHCFVPFLTQHYSRITLVDMRYINDSYNNVLDLSRYSQALFLYNDATFAEDRNIKKLNV